MNRLYQTVAFEEARLVEERAEAERAQIAVQERAVQAASKGSSGTVEDRSGGGAQAGATAATQWPTSLYPCGGAYPPCWVVEHESATAGLYSAFNANGCYAVINGVAGRGCYGKWQFGWFWGGKLGLPLDLAQATPAQQDEAARLLWNNGAGCSNWGAC